MVLVIDSTELDLGKHAYSQLKEFGVDAEVIKTDPLDAPRKIRRTEKEYALFAFHTDHRFAAQIVGKVLDIEREKHVEKVFVEKGKRSREALEREAKSKTREKAEKLAEEVNSDGS